MTSADHIPIVCIIGQTASGKSATVHQLLDAPLPMPCEIISVDALQVYRGFDIGTNKPSAQEQERYSYHLVDICSPDEHYNVARFAHDAHAKIREITARNAVPLLCGGSGYFLLRLLCGMPDTPPPNSEVRDMLTNRLRAEGIDALYDELVTIDPRIAQRISPRDRSRIIRALEIYTLSHRRPSTFDISSAIETQWNACIIQLEAQKEELHARIEQRTTMLFQRGLVDEVTALLNMGYGYHTAPMRGIGYQQFFDERGQARAYRQPQTLRSIAAEINHATKKYAKRQATYFRQFSQAHHCRWSDYRRIRTIVEDFLRSVA